MNLCNSNSTALPSSSVPPAPMEHQEFKWLRKAGPSQQRCVCDVNPVKSQTPGWKWSEEELGWVPPSISSVVKELECGRAWQELCTEFPVSVSHATEGGRTRRSFSRRTEPCVGVGAGFCSWEFTKPRRAPAASSRSLSTDNYQLSH